MGILREQGAALHRANYDTKADARAATILSIAVAPGRRNRGIGAILVKAFLDELRKRRVQEVSVTANVENEKANAFYREMNFELRKTFRGSEGREVNEYFVRVA